MFINISFPAHSSYILHSIELKLDIKVDHDVEQCILFLGYSPLNINRVMTGQYICATRVKGILKSQSVRLSDR